MLSLYASNLSFTSSNLIGYGGGYNERGTVEYKERVESDDEFDEFGRIKKKFRKSDVRDFLMNYLTKKKYINILTIIRM